MPDTSPTPVDPGDALSELYWLTDCHCDPAWTDRQLHAPDCNAYLRESVDVVAAELRSRTSIGPDSERIRELEAENVIADAIHTASHYPCDFPSKCFYLGGAHIKAQSVVAALRAAGLLPGPDDIVVSREALQTVLDLARPSLGGEIWKRHFDSLRAALSQPHPAQEQQT